MSFRRVSGPYSLVALLSAGDLKANPSLAWIPVDLTIASAVVVLIFVALSRLIDGPASSKVFVPITVWVLLLPLLAASVASDYTRTKLLTLFTVTFLLALAPFYLLRSREQRVTFLSGLIVVALFAGASLLFGAGQAQDVYGRIALVGSDTIGTGRIVAAGAIAAFAVGVVHRLSLRSRIALICVAGLLLAVAVMTGSRGPTLSALAALFVTVLLAPRFRRYRVRALLVTAALLGAVGFFLARDENAGIARILDFVTGDPESSGEVRHGLWAVAWNGIVRSPFGQGFGSFGSHNGYLIPYPHNIFLEIGFELGWLAVGIFVLLVFAAGLKSMRVATDVSGVALFGLFVFSFLGALVSSDLNGSRLFVVMLFAGLAASTSSVAEDRVRILTREK